VSLVVIGVEMTLFVVDGKARLGSIVVELGIPCRSSLQLYFILFFHFLHGSIKILKFCSIQSRCESSILWDLWVMGNPTWL
jgi:hypothetical protein